MERRQLTPDDAFKLLGKVSQHTNTKLAEVAAGNRWRRATCLICPELPRSQAGGRATFQSLLDDVSVPLR